MTTGCTTRLDRDPVTGIADCPECGFHGHPLDHFAYSLARAAGLSPARAIALAAAHHHTLTTARATGTTRAQAARLLAPAITATADRARRATHTRTAADVRHRSRRDSH
jgi:hypothetical protein